MEFPEIQQQAREIASRHTNLFRNKIEETTFQLVMLQMEAALMEMGFSILEKEKKLTNES